MTLAILCSGQGLQHRNMFALTGAAPEAADLFAHAATLLCGADPRELIKTATECELYQNRIGQLLCALQALAAAASLRSEFPRELIIAGYSVGEVAAWGVAGLIDMSATINLVVRRAEAMDAASPRGDGLLFVRGLSYSTIETLCKRHNVAVAIVNPGNAFVLGGAGGALDILATEATALDATRVVRLKVNVASHTARLNAASAEFRKMLNSISVKTSLDPGIRLFSAGDGAPVLDTSAGLTKLANQISGTVRWADCLKGCVEAGARTFLEFGPGRALAEMATATYPDIVARSVEDFRTLPGLRAWLTRLRTVECR